MAVVAQNGLDPNQQQPNQGGSGTTMGAPGGVAPGAGGSSAYQAPGASQAPRANPSGTPNVQDYLNANQGAGAKLSSGITQNYQNQANQYQQSLNSQQQNLNTQYNPLNSQVQGGQQYSNAAFQNPQALLDAYNQSQAQTQPGQTPATPNQADLQNYNNFESTVAGTQQNQQLQQGISGYQQAGQQAGNYLQAQLGQLGQTAALGNNAMGQQQLLQQTVGTPNYTPGQQGLDALFLQGQGNQLQQNLNNIYNTASGNTNAAAQDYQSKLNALQQLSGQNQAYTQNLFLNGANGQQGTGLNQIAGNVQQEYNALQQSVPQQQQAIQEALRLNKFTPDQLKSLGLTQGEQTYGVSLNPATNPYLTLNNLSTGAQGLAQAAGSDEFARYNALNQLAGGGTAGSQAQNSIFGTATSAGGFNPYNFNTQGFQENVASAKNAIENVDFQKAMQALDYQAANSGNGSIFRGTSGNPINQAESSVYGATSADQLQQQVQNLQNVLQQQGYGNVSLADLGSQWGFAPVTNYLNQLNAARGGTVGANDLLPTSQVAAIRHL